MVKDLILVLPEKLEKEISKFLSKKFGENVKITPLSMPQESIAGKTETRKKKKINFNLKPEQLVSYLDQYIVKQDRAKAILSTKICTHFNRVRHFEDSHDVTGEMVGGIKNNILIIISFFCLYGKQLTLPINSILYLGEAWSVTVT